MMKSETNQNRNEWERIQFTHAWLCSKAPTNFGWFSKSNIPFTPQYFYQIRNLSWKLLQITKIFGNTKYRKSMILLMVTDTTAVGPIQNPILLIREPFFILLLFKRCLRFFSCFGHVLFSIYIGSPEFG